MECHKILVLRLSAVGDVIRTLPAIKALKENDPTFHITWIVEEPSRTFLESQPEVDRVILFPRRRWTGGITSPWGLLQTAGEMGRFIRQLRNEQFDVVLDFHGILKSGILAFLSGAPRRIGFDRRSTKEGNFLFSNVKVRLPQKSISRYERNITLLRGMGLEVDYPKPDLHIPPGERASIEAFFHQLPTAPQRPLIAIHPGTNAKAAFKRWMPERYALLADRLIRELRATVIFTWGPGEREWVEDIRGKMTVASLVAPRTGSLTQLGEVLRQCDLYVGGDTGPMHVASLVGTPVVAIFGPTHPVENRPFGPHKMVRKEVGCSPCRKRSCKELICLDQVTVDDVLGAARDLLSSSWNKDRKAVELRTS
jgi:lipopolysaccharide heptosyltransferase I